MIGVSMSFENIGAYVERLKAAQEGARRSPERAMVKLAKRIMEESREVYVPIDTGFLYSTGKVYPPVGSGYETKVPMGYSAPYAVHVHEIPMRHVNLSRKTRKMMGFKAGRRPSWKYLSIPFRKHTVGLTQAIRESWWEFVNAPKQPQQRDVNGRFV